MTTQIKHPFTSAKADGADATLVRPSNWNAAHNPYLNKTNKSGGSVAQYDYVVSDISNDDAFTTTTTASDTRPGFVVQDAAGIANNATGNVLGAGWDTTVNVQGNVTRGNWLVTSTTAKRLADSGTASTSAAPAAAVGVATSAYGGGGAGTVTAYFGITTPSPSVLETGTNTAAGKVKNTTYQNTSGRMRRVYGDFTAQAGAINSGVVKVDSTSPPTTIRLAGGTNTVTAGPDVILPFCFFVPSNHYYRIDDNSGTITIGRWTEVDE